MAPCPKPDIDRKPGTPGPETGNPGHALLFVQAAESMLPIRSARDTEGLTPPVVLRLPIR